MAVIKVANNLFSATKTIDKALKKCQVADFIHVAPAHYKENLHIERSVNICGEHATILEGAITVTKHTHVQFRQMTIHPTTPITIDGHATFEDVTLDGTHVNAIISLSHSKATLKNCIIENAADIAIAAFKNSSIEIENCQFRQNGKTHILMDQSTGTIKQSTFTKSTHAIWLKNNSKVECTANEVFEQSGTQIIVQQSTYKDSESSILKSAGNGLFISKEAVIELTNCYLAQHVLPQIWVQESEITCTDTTIEAGDESGLMIRQQATCKLVRCHIKQHKIANIQLCVQSTFTSIESSINECEGFGMQIRDNSIAHFERTVFTKNVLAQLFLTDASIVSMQGCTVSHGQQVGIIAEKHTQCTAIESTISHHQNSGITILDAAITLIDTILQHNNGNGLLVLNEGVAQVDQCTFEHNHMPHIGGKNYAAIEVAASSFSNGKSLYAIDHCDIRFEDCHFSTSKGVQIELNDQSKASFLKCSIQHGHTNAIKLLRNSNAILQHCQIAHHRLPQLVANDSSFVLKNCEVTDGERNGFIIENHAEAHIEETYIARHKYPQVWVDMQSTVDLLCVQLMEGMESDLYLQNESRLYAHDSFIQNLTFTYNIQSINHSKIELQNTVIEHFSGDCFYTENNSEIIAKSDDEYNHEKK